MQSSRVVKCLVMMSNIRSSQLSRVAKLLNVVRCHGRETLSSNRELKVALFKVTGMETCSNPYAILPKRLNPLTGSDQSGIWAPDMSEHGTGCFRFNFDHPLELIWTRAFGFCWPLKLFRCHVDMSLVKCDCFCWTGSFSIHFTFVGICL